MISFKQNKMYRYLVLLTISSTLGLEAWLILFNNFAVEAVGLEGSHIGIIQSIREIPGFLTFLIVFVLLLIKEHRLSSLSIVVLGLGMAATGILPSYFGLIFTTLIMSLGFHFFCTTCDSLTLQYFDKKTAPWVMGKLLSLGAVTNIGVGILIYFTASLLNFTQIYLLIGCLIMAVGFWGLFQDPANGDIIPQHKKIVLRKKYWLYYFLTFMAGARRQIFMAFAVFLMVKKFNFSVQEVTILFVINNVMNYFGLCIRSIQDVDRDSLPSGPILLQFSYCHSDLFPKNWRPRRYRRKHIHEFHHKPRCSRGSTGHRRYVVDD
jgi:hypothetical protein